MKNIRFREYDPSRRDFLYSQRLEGASETVFNFEPYQGNNNWIGNNQQHQLMQFTGVYDANGKPIYEGDIVKVDDDKETTVYFNHGRFEPVYKYNEDRLKVIGNVFKQRR